MKKAFKHTYTAVAVTLLIIAAILITSLVGGGARKAHAAATTSAESIESSNVWNDLQTMTLDGKSLDLGIYKFDSRKSAQLITLAEYCYSAATDKQSDYGLYVYVYNPQGYDWTKNESLNKISMRFGGYTSAGFVKYDLKYLNRSEEPGYEGLFYKFKVDFTAAQKEGVLNTLSVAQRIYEVSEIELCGSGYNATAYSVENKFTYTGVVKGYGEGGELHCTAEGLDVTLSLDVHATAYRPEETNGKPYTQDTLHSVYFSIPNSIIAEYGGLYGIHATWLNARTKPIFVTGNKEVYDSLSAEVETEYGKPSDTDYAFAVNAVERRLTGAAAGLQWYESDLAYNVKGVGGNCTTSNPNQTQLFGMVSKDTLDELYYCFYAETGDADTYELNGEELIDYLVYYCEHCCDTPTICENDYAVADKYSSLLFESWDKEATDANITADDKYTLTSTKLKQSFWEKFLGKPGTAVEYSKTFDNIEAIHAVKSTDFSKSQKVTCDNLLISESYYADFKSFYDRATAANETVYLFRYYQSEYESREVTEFIRRYNVNSFNRPSVTGGNCALEKLDTNAYLAQETINLDFDIIDVTCRKGEVDTVIPVVMSPVDLAPGVTPPVDTTPEPEDGFNFWQWLADLFHTSKKTAKIIFFAVVTLILLAILMPVLSVIFPAFRAVLKRIFNGIASIAGHIVFGIAYGIGFVVYLIGLVVTAPFRWCYALIKKLAGKKKKTGEENGESKKSTTSKRRKATGKTSKA